MATVIVIDDGPYALNGDIHPYESRLSAQLSAVEVVYKLCKELEKKNNNSDDSNYGVKHTQTNTEDESDSDDESVSQDIKKSMSYVRKRRSKHHLIGVMGAHSARCYLNIGDDVKMIMEQRIENSSSSEMRHCSESHLMSSKWIEKALLKAKLMLKAFFASDARKLRSCRILFFTCTPNNDMGAKAIDAGRSLQASGIALDIISFGDAYSIDANSKTVHCMTSQQPSRALLHELLRSFGEEKDELVNSGGMFRIGRFCREIDVVSNLRPAARAARAKNARLYLNAAPPEWRSAVLRLARPMKVPSKMKNDSEDAVAVDKIAEGLSQTRKQQANLNLPGPSSMATCNFAARFGANAKLIRELSLMRPRLRKIELLSKSKQSSTSGAKDSAMGKYAVQIEMEKENIDLKLVNATRVAHHVLKNGVLISARESLRLDQSFIPTDGGPSLEIEVQQLIPMTAGFVNRKLIAGQSGRLSVIRAGSSCENSISYVIFRPHTGAPTDVAAIFPCGLALAQLVACKTNRFICGIEVNCSPRLTTSHSFISGKKTCLFFFQVMAENRSKVLSREDSISVCETINEILNCKNGVKDEPDGIQLSSCDDLIPAGCMDLWASGESSSEERKLDDNESVSCSNSCTKKTSLEDKLLLTAKDAERLLVQGMEGTDLSANVQALWSISGTDQSRIHGHGLVPIRNKAESKMEENDVGGGIECDHVNESNSKDDDDVEARMGWLAASSVGKQQWACIAHFGLRDIDKFQISLDKSVISETVGSSRSNISSPSTKAKTVPNVFINSLNSAKEKAIPPSTMRDGEKNIVGEGNVLQRQQKARKERLEAQSFISCAEILDKKTDEKTSGTSTGNCKMDKGDLLEQYNELVAEKVRLDSLESAPFNAELECDDSAVSKNTLEQKPTQMPRRENHKTIDFQSLKKLLRD